ERVVDADSLAYISYGLFFVFFKQKTAYEMALDEKKAGDEVVEQDGVEFFIDNESAEHLRGATLDFRDGLTGVGFHIVNPNASRTCGCGSSFETARPA